MNRRPPAASTACGYLALAPCLPFVFGGVGTFLLPGVGTLLGFGAGCIFPFSNIYGVWPAARDRFNRLRAWEDERWLTPAVSEVVEATLLDSSPASDGHQAW